MRNLPPLLFSADGDGGAVMEAPPAPPPGRGRGQQADAGQTNSGSGLTTEEQIYLTTVRTQMAFYRAQSSQIQKSAVRDEYANLVRIALVLQTFADQARSIKPPARFRLVHALYRLATVLIDEAARIYQQATSDDRPSDVGVGLDKWAEGDDALTEFETDLDAQAPRP
ncbi:MAG TPA: hypothetical protein VKY74_10790 [Chloroflexia bacterium]|nr:hypothetical protein [Chloroflexia bacterium]